MRAFTDRTISFPPPDEQTTTQSPILRPRRMPLNYLKSKIQIQVEKQTRSFYQKSCFTHHDRKLKYFSSTKSPKQTLKVHNQYTTLWMLSQCRISFRTTDRMSSRKYNHSQKTYENYNKKHAISCLLYQKTQKTV